MEKLKPQQKHPLLIFRLLFLALTLTTLGLAILMEGKVEWIFALFLPASIWFVSLIPGWEWASSLAFFLFGLAAGIGAWLNMPLFLLAFCVISALSTWDLDFFAQRLAQAGRIENSTRLIQRHIIRLLRVNGIGMILAMLAASIRLNLSFGITVLLSLLILAGLAPAIAYLRRQSSL